MAMQKLNVRFSDKTKDSIATVALRLGRSESDIARAALNKGIIAIESEEKLLFGKDTIHIAIDSHQ
jgi:predicted transcriptional regulator